MTLNIPKGIAVAVVAFTLATNITEIPQLGMILNLVVTFMLFSLIVSTFVSKFDHWFLDQPKDAIADKTSAEEKK